MKDMHKKALMRWSKEDLVEHVMRLEYNNTAQAETFEIQYQNCMKMFANMNLLNNGLKAA